MTKGYFVATCGCRVEDLADLVTVRTKDLTRDGRPAVSYSQFCKPCAEKAAKWDGFLPDEDAASEFIRRV